jgi:diadenosine tetraphosphate (Ap4A) HIT family hydrolase
MDNFELDSRLAKDCLVLGEVNISLLLLVNNSLLPWFILVPKTSEREVTDLSSIEQASLLEEINHLAAFVKDNFEVSKLNIAAIGNIVSQLHVHVIGRDPSDFCWPDVVWGTSERKPYSDLRVEEITTALKEHLGDKIDIVPFNNGIK